MATYKNRFDNFTGDNNRLIGKPGPRALGLIVLALAISSIAVFLSAKAEVMAPGDLDTTFSGDGRFLYGTGVDVGDTATGVAIQSDGKSVIVGSSGTVGTILRLNVDGSLDTTLPWGGATNEFPRSVIIQSDGSIITASSTGQLRRIAPGGGTSNFANVGGSAELTLAPGDKVIAVGNFSSSGGSGFDIVRLNADGSLDTTFNGTGRASPNFSLVAAAREAAIQPDGKIVIVGTGSANNLPYWAVARLNDNGTLDACFDGDGQMTLNFPGVGNPAFNVEMAILPNGGIALGASFQASSVADVALITALTPDGQQNMAFGCTGYAKLLTGGRQYLDDLLVKDGILFAVGRREIFPATVDQVFITYRIQPNGQVIDTTTTQYNDGADGAFSGTFQADGKLLLVGTAGYPSPRFGEIAAVRYMPFTAPGAPGAACPGPTPTPSPTATPIPTYGDTFTVVNTNDSGAGSLRQAIADATTAPGADTIVFSPLFDTPQTITLTTGNLLFANSGNANATVLGPGSNLLTVSGGNASRVFTTLAGSRVTLYGMKVTGGNAVSGTQTGLGGGVYTTGTLTLVDMIVTGNTAISNGGGVYAGGTFPVTLDRTTVSNNTSNFDNNTTGDGGGVYSLDGSLTLNRAVVSGNTAQGTNKQGGGIFLFSSSAIITDSAISGNTAGGFGGGLSSVSAASLTIRSSTISGNNAAQSGGGTSSGSMTMSNSTVSGNTAGTGGGGIVCSGSAFISGSTIVSNSTTAGDGGGMSGGAGNHPITNSIVANNTGPLSPDYKGNISGSYNLVENVTGTGFSAAATNNITGQDPNLGPLANNGGPTFTHLPLAGSPVIDKGKSGALTTDQRGLARPFDDLTIANAAAGDGADIGAVELQPAGPRADPRPAGAGYGGPFFSFDIETTPTPNDADSFDPLLAMLSEPVEPVSSRFVAPPRIEGACSTAAGVTVTGRVRTAEGRGVRSANVTLTDQNGITKTVAADPRGNFSFTDVEVGQTYIICAVSGRFTFEPRVLQVFDHLMDIDLVALQ